MYICYIYTDILIKFQKSRSSKERRESWGKWCQIIFSFRCLLLLTLLCFKRCLFTLQESVKLIFINKCETSFDMDIAAANYSWHGRSTWTGAQFLLWIWWRSLSLRPFSVSCLLIEITLHQTETSRTSRLDLV